MSYSFNNLTTIAACDEYVNECGREKTAALNKKNNLLTRLQDNAGTSTLEARIAFLSTRIASLEALIAQNPPEEDRQAIQMDLGDLIKDRAMLERKVDQIGDNWQIEAMFEANVCDAEIALRDALIVEINAHKATLAA